MNRRSPLLLAVLATLAAAPTQPALARPAPVLPAAGPVAATGAAEQVAAQQVAGALAAAADAAATGNRAGLARALGVLERSGARALPPPETEAGPLVGAGAIDPVAGWRDSVRDLAGPPFRGSPLGPGYRSGRLGSGGRDSFNQLFLSGTGTTIALSAPTGDRVGLRVLDKQARAVCEGDTVRSQPCRWVPLFTERYTIVVTNLGAGDARYFLVIQ